MIGELVGFTVLTAALVAIWRRLGEVLKHLQAWEVGEDHDRFSPTCPVFSEAHLRRVQARAVQATAEKQSCEARIDDSPLMKEHPPNESTLAELRQLLTDVCQARIKEEREWYHHSVMFEANLDVVLGKATRDQALSLAWDRWGGRHKHNDFDEVRARVDLWLDRLSSPERLNRIVAASRAMIFATDAAAKKAARAELASLDDDFEGKYESPWPKAWEKRYQ